MKNLNQKYTFLQVCCIPFLVLLTGCPLTPNANMSPGIELLKSAKRVPMPVGQAVSLGTQIYALQNMKTRSISDTNFVNFTSEDPLGNPAMHIVFTLNEPVKDWYDFAQHIPERPKSDSETTTMIGATTAHNIIGGAQSNINTLYQMRLAIEKIGSIDNFKRFVSLSNSFEGLYVEAKNNDWVKVNDQPEIVLESLKTSLVASFQKGADSLVESKVAGQLEGNWQEILEPKTAAQRQTLKQLTSGSNLNLNATKTILDRQARISPQQKTVNSGVSTRSETQTTAYCWWFLWWQICVDQVDTEATGAAYMRTLPVSSEWGGLTSSGLSGGFNQVGSAYNQPSYSVTGQNVAGCSASAFSSQVSWFWQNGVKFYGLNPAANIQYFTSLAYNRPQYLSRYTGDSPTNRLMERQPDGYPLFTRWARGYYFNGGTMVTPWNFENAVNYFLQTQNAQFGLNLSLDSAYTLSPFGYGLFQALDNAYRIGEWYLAIPTLLQGVSQAILQYPFTSIYNVFRQPEFGNIMRRHIGQKGEFVIAMYPTGRSDFEAHYSAIMKGRIIYHAIRPEILIEPLDKFNGRDWYMMSDPMSLFVGVFALNR
jgi:hypothetical protein